MISANLKYLRRKLKLTQRQFAAKLGVNEKMYQVYEYGRCRIPIEIVVKVCQQYKYDMMKFCTEDLKAISA